MYSECYIEAVTCWKHAARCSSRLTPRTLQCEPMYRLCVRVCFS